MFEYSRFVDLWTLGVSGLLEEIYMGWLMDFLVGFVACVVLV